MVALSEEHVDSDHGQRGSGGGLFGRKRLADRSKYLYHPAQRSGSFVPHVGASRGGELGSDEDRPVVGDVLDHAEPPHAPLVRPLAMRAYYLTRAEFIFTGNGARGRR